MFEIFNNPTVLGIVGVVVAVIVTVIIIVKRYRIATPDEAIIVTGRKGKNIENLSGQKVVTGGGVFVLPIVQKSFTISLRSRQLNITTKAQTSNGITIQARAVAIVKVGGSEEMIRSAAQRFLSSQEEIESSTQEVLSGSLRGIIGTLTVEDIIRDRQALAASVLEAAEEALTKQGLAVDTLQIQEINDESNYLDNIGRPQAAHVLQVAEIADVEAKRAAQEASIAADQTILERNRELQLRRAQVQEETDRAEAQASAARPLEETIQRQRIVEEEEITAVKETKLREQQLNATVRKEADAEAYRAKTLMEADAEANRRRRELESEAVEREALAAKVSRLAAAEATEREGLARAKATEAEGLASAAAIQARADALKAQSDSVLAQDLIAKLPEIAQAFGEAYSNIGNFTVISADGSNKVQSEMVGNIHGLQTMIKDTTGIDLTSLITGAVTGGVAGNSAGKAIGNSLPKPPELD